MNTTGSPGRRSLRTGLVVLAAAAALLLSACSSGSSGGGSGAGGGGGDTTSQPAPVSINITPAANIALNPTTPVEVKATGGTLQQVKVTNAKTGTVVQGEFSADKTSWHSTVPLAYGAGYQVQATGVNGQGKSAQQSSTVNTLTPKSTIYPSLIPPPSTAGDVGVGQPIVVRFDKSVPDKAAAERALQVTSTPQQAGGWYWISNKEVHYRPQSYWQPGTVVKLHIGIYGKDLGGGVYGDTDRDLTMKVHDAWVAKADGNTEKMDIFDNGKLVKTMPISMGKDATPTHVGAHVISQKDRAYTMDSCTYGVCKGSPGYYRSTEYYAERISNDGEFVHENPDSVGSQGSSNVSHGCINLNQANASWFFDHMGPGDVVEVTNSGGQKLPVYDTYGDWSLSWSDWLAGSALK